MWRSFPYSRRSFVQNLAFTGAIIPVTLALFALVDTELLYPGIIVVLEIAVFVVLGVSPLMTTHELADGMLVLRQGWYFKAEVPVAEIRSAERLPRGPARTGVFFRLTSSTLFVTSRSTDLVEMRLKSKRSFGWALGKKADRVIFDVEDTDALLRVLKDDRLLAPVDA